MILKVHWQREVWRSFLLISSLTAYLGSGHGATVSASFQTPNFPRLTSTCFDWTIPRGRPYQIPRPKQLEGASSGFAPSSSRMAELLTLIRKHISAACIRDPGILVMTHPSRPKVRETTLPSTRTQLSLLGIKGLDGPKKGPWTWRVTLEDPGGRSWSNFSKPALLERFTSYKSSPLVDKGWHHGYLESQRHEKGFLNISRLIRVNYFLEFL